MIYYMDFLEKLNENEYISMYEKLSCLLPDFRRQKAEALRSASMRAESAMSYLLLCYGLNKEYPEFFPMSYHPKFAYNESGKPYLKAHSDIHFNISHCRNSIACAIHSADVGIDIQDVRAPRAALLNRFEGIFSEEEEEFTKKWSRIEAIGKLIGTGITPELIYKYGAPDFPASHNITVFTQKKAAAYISAAFYGEVYFNSNITSVLFSELSS